MTITKEEVAEAVRVWAHAWHTRDMQTIMAMEAQAVGFGFRPFAWRNHPGNTYPAGRDRSLEQFFGQKMSYSVALQELQTAVEGDVGLAWGVFLEQWQDKGQPPEQARVRFSKVLTRGAQGWQVVLYHRDIQPFAADGCYPKALTIVSPAS